MRGRPECLLAVAVAASRRRSVKRALPPGPKPGPKPGPNPNPLLQPQEGPPPPNHDSPFDVIIVGAGALGVGLAIMLTRVFDLDPERVLLIERGSGVGYTFRQWPKEMRFISPSFNQQGWVSRGKTGAGGGRGEAGTSEAVR